MGNELTVDFLSESGAVLASLAILGDGEMDSLHESGRYEYELDSLDYRLKEKSGIIRRSRIDHDRERGSIEPGNYVVSPIDNLRKDMPPQLILLGELDHILSAEHSKTYQQKVEALGSRCDVVMFEGAKHGSFYNGKYYAQGVPSVIRFLRELNLMPK